MRICSVLYCGRKHLAKGYCGKHIQQIYEHGKIISSGRSKNDPNEIIIIDNVAYMKMYDNHGIEVAETNFDSTFVHEVSKYKWFYSREIGYASASWLDNTVWRQMLLSRFLIYLSGQVINECFKVDHIDGNRLNNILSNLRICTTQQNNRNASKDPTKHFSKYKGVTAHQGNFKTMIYVNQKGIYIGYFKDEIAAAKAYNIAAIKYFGEFAKLNDV